MQRLSPSVSSYLSHQAMHSLNCTSRALRLKLCLRPSPLSQRQRSTKTAAGCLRAGQLDETVLAEGSISGLSLVLDTVKWTAEGLVVAVAQVSSHLPLLLF